MTKFEKPTSPTTGNFLGHYKVYLESDEAAIELNEKKYDIKFKNEPVIIDIVSEAKNLFLNLTEEVTAEKISEAGIFKNLVGITEHKNAKFHTLTFDTYQDADAAFD